MDEVAVLDSYISGQAWHGPWRRTRTTGGRSIPKANSKGLRTSETVAFEPSAIGRLREGQTSLNSGRGRSV